MDARVKGGFLRGVWQQLLRIRPHLADFRFSKKMSQNIVFIQLRYLQTLNSISAEKNSTIIFPFPVDLFTNLIKWDKKDQQGP
jgi:hypothetical protein